MFYHTIYPSPLGDLTLLADDQALYGLWFSDQQHYGANYDLGRSKGQVTPLLTRVTTCSMPTLPVVNRIRPPCPSSPKSPHFANRCSA